MNRAERLWNLRDGVLAWLYELRINGSSIAEAKPAEFMEATDWSDAEVTRDELNEAVEWLTDEGYVDGIRTMQGGSSSGRSSPPPTGGEVRGVGQERSGSARRRRCAEPLPAHRGKQRSRRRFP